MHRLGLDRDATFESGLRSAVAPWADDTATGTGTPAAGDEAWRPTGTFFLQWDAWFQDELGRRAESLANGYLLGRGLAECFWGLAETARLARAGTFLPWVWESQPGGLPRRRPPNCSRSRLAMAASMFSSSSRSCASTFAISIDFPEG